MKTYLQVPFQDKNEAKRLGARFDMSRGQWYCPDGVDLAPMIRWLAVDGKALRDMNRALRKADRAGRRDP